MSKLKVAFLAFAFGTISPMAQAQQESLAIGVYRDTAGVLYETTPNSRQIIEEQAKRNGYVTLWLTLNLEYDVYLDPETQQDEIVAQDLNVANIYEYILSEYVARGAVWHPKTGPFIRGPGCMIRAKKQAVKKLFGEEKLNQITLVAGD